MTRTEDEARLYEEVGRLARVLGGPRRLADSSAGDGWPTRGLYLFFEEGETCLDGSPQITRIGTHALRQQSMTTLWGRLAQHRGQVGGQNPGGVRGVRGHDQHACGLEGPGLGEHLEEIGGAVPGLGLRSQIYVAHGISEVLLEIRWRLRHAVSVPPEWIDAPPWVWLPMCAARLALGSWARLAW